LALATNTIANDVEAYIAGVSGRVTTTVGGITLTATESAVIHATAAAASLAVGGGVDVGAGISGAGAEATNDILGIDNAYVIASNLGSATIVKLDAEDQSEINATVVGASAA